MYKNNEFYKEDVLTDIDSILFYLKAQAFDEKNYKEFQTQRKTTNRTI